MTISVRWLRSETNAPNAAVRIMNKVERCSAQAVAAPRPFHRRDAQRSLRPYWWGAQVACHGAANQGAGGRQRARVSNMIVAGSCARHPERGAAELHRLNTERPAVRLKDPGPP